MQNAMQKATGCVILAMLATTANANGRIFLSNSNDKKIDITYHAPTTTSTPINREDELSEAINRLSASAQAAESRAYAATQNYYGNQALGFSGAYAQNLSSNAAPSIAARFAKSAAHDRSTRRCALYVRKALQQAGYKFTPQASAYMYANGTLAGAGFVQISSNGYTPQVGDVVVFNRTNKNPHGHIQIFDGSGWVSDFKQPGFSPYNDNHSFTVWRDARYMDASNTGIYLAYQQ